MSNRIPGAIATVIPAAGLVTGGFGVRKPVILGVGNIKGLVQNEKVIRGITAGSKDVLANTLYDSSSIISVGNSPGTSDWTQGSQWVADTTKNAVDWSPGPEIPGNVAITQYGQVLVGSSFNTFTPVNTGAWSSVSNYYVGGTLTITNPDSSNYGVSQTITAYNNITLQFTTNNFANLINVNDKFIVTLQPDEPASGQEYYVTYYKKLANFTLTEYTAEADIKADHGDITLTDGTTANRVTIGALLALRNGAQSVIVGQLDYTNWGNKYTPTTSEFNASLAIQLESLKTLTANKLYIVPMTTDITAITSVWNHCNIMSAPENKAERTCVAGMVRGTSVATFKSTAQGFSSTRMILMAPSECRFNDLTSYAFDGSIAAAAFAGMRCFPTRIAQSITGSSPASITIETTYTPSQQRDLLGAGVAVLLARAGVITILHDKSTNVATADTEENAIVELADYLKRTTRDTLFNIYKGAPIDKTLPGAMSTTLARIFEKEITNVNIVEYKDISVQQSSSEPRLVLVNAKVKPAYPLVWIDITMSFYV